jgi:deoxyadenosine/deoxycytidine kinase
LNRTGYTLAPPLEFRYFAIEGPIGLGKAVLAERLGVRLNATVIRDETDNPFLADFYAGRSGAAFQTQLFFTLARHRRLLKVRQGDLFNQSTISDFLFERDRIYAFLNLDDNELFIYQRLYELVARDLISPDLVIYLQTPTDVLRRRVRERATRDAVDEAGPRPSDEYLGELNEAYNHFFFHYSATPLLVVETSQLDLTWGDAALDELERQMRSMTRGTQYYVPRTT